MGIKLRYYIRYSENNLTRTKQVLGAKEYQDMLQAMQLKKNVTVMDHGIVTI